MTKTRPEVNCGYEPAIGIVDWEQDTFIGPEASSPHLSEHIQRIRSDLRIRFKYVHGATVPTGDTEFRFKAAGMDFKSTAYEWLVVSGARAQHKGTGTINGAGIYSFLLTAIDGALPGGNGTDRFRLKITDPGGVVYDNQLGASDNQDPSTVFGGGSIVIHP